MKNRTTLMTLGLGLLANYLLWDYWSGVCFPLFMTVLVGLTLWKANESAKHMDSGHALLASFSVLFSVFVAIRGAAGLSLANLCLAIYFWLLLSHSIASERSFKNFGPWDYFYLPRKLGFGSIGAGSRELSEHSCQAIGFSRGTEKEKEIRNGILISIPVIALFLILMVFADQSFQSFVSRIFSWIADLFKNIHLFRLMGRTGFIWMVTVSTLGMFIFFRQRPETPSEAPEKPKMFSFTSGMVVMGLVNLLFLVFSIFQIKFMLGYADGPIAGMTNRGNFYVMMTIGLLAFLGSCALEGTLKRQSDIELKLYRINAILAVLFTLIVMVSAYYRFTLYENEWGFTIRRFYAHSFVPYVALFYLLLIGKILGRWSRTVFLNSSMILTTGLLLFWNVLSPHAFVARKNGEITAIRGPIVPPVYLQSLSYDAVPELVEQLVKTNRTNSSIESFFFSQKAILEQFPKDSWRSMHWSRQEALTALNQYEARIGRPLSYGGYPMKSSNIDSWFELLFCIMIGLGVVVFITSMVL